MKVLLVTYIDIFLFSVRKYVVLHKTTDAFYLNCKNSKSLIYYKKFYGLEGAKFVKGSKISANIVKGDNQSIEKYRAKINHERQINPKISPIFFVEGDITKSIFDSSYSYCLAKDASGGTEFKASELLLNSFAPGAEVSAFLLFFANFRDLIL